MLRYGTSYMTELRIINTKDRYRDYRFPKVVNGSERKNPLFKRTFPPVQIIQYRRTRKKSNFLITRF